MLVEYTGKVKYDDLLDAVVQKVVESNFICKEQDRHVGVKQLPGNENIMMTSVVSFKTLTSNMQYQTTKHTQGGEGSSCVYDISFVPPARNRGN